MAAIASWADYFAREAAATGTRLYCHFGHGEVVGELGAQGVVYLVHRTSEVEGLGYLIGHTLEEGPLVCRIDHKFEEVGLVGSHFGQEVDLETFNRADLEVRFIQVTDSEEGTSQVATVEEDIVQAAIAEEDTDQAITEAGISSRTSVQVVEGSQIITGAGTILANLNTTTTTVTEAGSQN